MYGKQPSGSRSQTAWNGSKVHVLNRGDKAIEAMGSVQCANPVGELVKAMICGTNRTTPDSIRNALTTSDNNRAGFLVPSPLSSQFIDLARNKSVVLEAGAQTIIMEGAELSLATLLTDPTFAPHAELATITLSDATFGRVTLNAVTVACRMQLSRELAEDAPNVAMIIESTLANSLAQQVDYFCIRGSGASFTGLINDSNISDTSSIGAIAWGDLSAAATAVRENNIEPTCAIMYPTVKDAVMDSKDSQLRWLGPPPSIQDVRMLSSKNVPVGNVIIGDFSNLAWGIRQGALLEVSNVADDSFEKHGVSVKMTWRGDFALLRASAFHRLEDVTAS